MSLVLSTSRMLLPVAQWGQRLISFSCKNCKKHSPLQLETTTFSSFFSTLLLSRLVVVVVPLLESNANGIPNQTYRSSRQTRTATHPKQKTANANTTDGSRETQSHRPRSAGTGPFSATPVGTLQHATVPNPDLIDSQMAPQHPSNPLSALGWTTDRPRTRNQQLPSPLLSRLFICFLLR